MRQKIGNYIRSGHAGIYLVSHEEARVEAGLKAVADGLKRPLHVWSARSKVTGHLLATFCPQTVLINRLGAF